MTTIVAERAVRQAVQRATHGFGADVLRLRSDAGIPRTALARAAGIDQSYLARIERGTASPSPEVCARLALALGADLAIRLYPNTGPMLRDRHQAPILEALLRTVDPRWLRSMEVAVRRPSRGWIDLVLCDMGRTTAIATEIQSDLRRLEQLIRWSAAKADALPSWDGWSRLGPVTISRLLVIRDTRANREVADQARRQLRVAFPGDPRDALESLTGAAPWPGAAVLWAARERVGSAYRIVARP